jgi:type IV secretion system protein VirB10
MVTLAGLVTSQARAQNPENVTIPAGTKFKVSLQTPISSKLSEVGDTVVVSLLEPIRIDQHTAIARGTELTGKITQMKRAGRVKGRAEVYVLINELNTSYGSESIAVSVDAVDDFGSDEKIKADEEGKLIAGRDLGGDLSKAAEGGSLGSIASVPIAIATRSAGPALIGPGAGALAGVLLTRGKEIGLPVGTVFRLKFDKDLTLPASGSRVSTIEG